MAIRALEKNPFDKLLRFENGCVSFHTYPVPTSAGVRKNFDA
jgi:hypothetical protein